MGEVLIIVECFLVNRQPEFRAGKDRTEFEAPQRVGASNYIRPGNCHKRCDRKIQKLKAKYSGYGQWQHDPKATSPNGGPLL